MRDTFFAYYRPSDRELSELWANCTFVLDANVLLNLYRYPQAAREDLLRILERISDRLWVPHQAALEYQENRLAVIAKQLARYGQVKRILQNVSGTLNEELNHLQLSKRHTLIDPDSLLQPVEQAIDGSVKKLNTLECKQPDVFDDDDVRNRLDRLLAGRIGPPPESQEELNGYYVEGEARYAKSRPPGYLDEKEKRDEESYWHRGMTFRREYGDLILWKQIVKQAQAQDEEDALNIILAHTAQRHIPFLGLS